MKHCIIRFKDGKEEQYKTSFEGLEKGEEVVVELLVDGYIGMSRAEFVKYINKTDLPSKKLHSVVGRWLDE